MTAPIPPAANIASPVSVKRKSVRLAVSIMSAVLLAYAWVVFSQGALIYAAANGNVRLASVLMSLGVNPKTAFQPGYTVVQSASYGQAPTLTLFLKRGVSPDSELDTGESALILAIQGQHANTVSVLLKAGANPNLDCDGHDPLDYAIDSGNAQIETALRRYGAVAEADVKQRKV